VGALPTRLSPVGGLHFPVGLTYFDHSSQVLPIIDNWGIMVVGIGKTTIIFSTLEKSYMVSEALYGVLIGTPYARNYLAALITDSRMMLGGIWYLLRSRQLKPD